MRDNTKLTRDELLDVIDEAGGAYLWWRPVGGVGDEVMKLPAYTAFKKQIGNDLLVAAVVDYIEPVVRYHSSIDHVLKMSPLIGTNGKRGMCEEDREYMAKLEKLGCVLTKFSFPCPAARYESESGTHITKSRQQIWCEHVGVEFDIDNYNFELLPDELDAVDELGFGDRYVAVQHRSYGKWRDYPRTERLYSELVKLGKEMDFRVVAIDKSVKVKMQGVLNLVGADLRLVFAVIAKALLFIGPDSMGCHVRGALGGSQLGLFGPTNPSVRLKYRNAHWIPRYEKCPRQYCWYKPCGVRFRKRWRKHFKFCLSALPADYIAKLARMVLEGGRPNEVYSSWR